MNEFLTNDTKVIILLCGFFGNNKSIKPLSQGKYNSIARWLHSNKMRPEDLFEKENIKKAAEGSGIEFEHLNKLLERGVELGFAVEEWQRNGIWIISRSDKNYPSYYKKHLKEQSPALLYGVGDISLLNNGGIGIVGSRNVDDEGVAFTQQTAEICALNNIPVISGAARGVDQISMITALNYGGISVGVLAENLLKTSLDRSYRNAIADKKLVLVSHRHPTSAFTVGAAMARNKLIYALSDYSLVVSSEFNKGGTWAGAVEELKRDNAIPVFVRSGGSVPSGNKKLLDLGAVEWPKELSLANLRSQLNKLSLDVTKKINRTNLNLFDIDKLSISQSDKSNIINNDLTTTDISNSLVSQNLIYEAILPIMMDHIRSAITIDELSMILNISKAQLNIWIIKAIEDGKIRKLIKPVRYEKV